MKPSAKQYLLKAAGWGILLYTISLFDLYARALQGMREVNALLAYTLLKHVDASIIQTGNTLWSTVTGEAVTVHSECTGYEIVSVIAVFILAFPAKLGARVLGLACAALLMTTVNLTRIVSIYLLSTHRPAWVPTVHEEIWPILINIAAVGSLVVWFMWLQEKDEKDQKDKNAQTPAPVAP